VGPSDLQRLGADPAVALDALTAWAAEHPDAGLRRPQDMRGLQETALEIREIDGGRALGSLVDHQPPRTHYARWGARRSWRFAREHHMLTRDHLVHAARLVRARARVRRQGGDVRLHGVSFLGHRVELTAPRGSGRLVVGPWCWLGDDAALRAHCGRITLGAKVVLGGGSIINAYLDVSIGDGTLIAEGVHITDFDHRIDRVDVPIKDQGVVTSPVRIGADVWLGRGVTVLRGVDIGQGSVIGAHAVVTRDIPPYSVAVGVPARVIRTRLPGDRLSEGPSDGSDDPSARRV
jgi:acetyltransferase-like isoleucine patch superfamily enzyme